ncbi:FkbM family methyltransferase [Catalinimonas alkaloidigena]|uniref:FkbM family methyltransferase n=1 Tax=Catalinimonas alkaloidigena TaxID=1075417 RepID=UPI0024050292|nr:FkbM family methyltransferase [Catalinimonas alkaloidigena]MDF9795704.1 FkbM family methyltransferase [Catalinimonas alkaloidigena]
MINKWKRKFLNQAAYFVSYLKLYPLIQKDLSNTLVIDCGANQGDISALFARTGAKIYAYEPDPIAFKILESKFSSNPDVKCVPKAVWVENGQIDLYLHSDQEGENIDFTVSSSIVKGKKNVSERNNIQVETINLIELIKNESSPISVLKLDVEGAEIALLQRIIEEELYKKIALILVETHENKIEAHVQPVQEMRKLIEKKEITNIKLNWV